MPNCKGCGNSIPSGSKVCPFCGMEAISAQMFRIGEIFDEKYEIVSFLGAGGMGEIYKVRHIHLEDIRVIKIMRQAFAQDQQDLKRFLQEAKIATRLHHPNVAILYDFSQYKTGLFYMVWEYIPGFDISVVLKKCGRFPVGIAIHFISQALEGLAYIHKNGIVHRDISPENLMIYKDPLGDLNLKIIDLGIAKTTALGDEHLTQTGMFLGKLKYCSPEQVGALEEGEKIDGRTDIYSIGLVLYEMLSGKSAIYSTTPYGYIHKHITQTPDPLQLPDLDRETNEKFNEVLFRALEKDRKKRYQNAESFKEELLYLPIKEPEKEELEGFLKDLFEKEKKKEEVSERPTIIPFQKTLDKTIEIEKKETIHKPEKIERKEVSYEPTKIGEKTFLEKTKIDEKETILKPQKPIPKVEVLKKEKTKVKKKINLIYIFIGIFVLILGVFLTLKFKSKKEEEVFVPKYGIVKIHFLPYGIITSLKNEKGEEVNLEDKITPLFARLDEGEYFATVLLEPSKELINLNFKVEEGRVLEIYKPAPPEVYETILQSIF